MMRSPYNCAAAMKAPTFAVADHPIRILAPNSAGNAALTTAKSPDSTTGRFTVRVEDGKAVIVRTTLLQLPA